MRRIDQDNTVGCFDNAVIRAQIPTALTLLLANVVIMYFFAYR